MIGLLQRVTSASVSVGTQRDAVWLSFAANKDHGVRRAKGVVKEIIEKILKDILKKDVHLKQEANKEMIGGAVLIVGDELYDVSVPGALEHLSEFLQDSSFLRSEKD